MVRFKTLLGQPCQQRCAGLLLIICRISRDPNTLHVEDYPGVPAVAKHWPSLLIPAGHLATEEVLWNPVLSNSFLWTILALSLVGFSL